MRVRLLGPVDIVVNGQPRPVAGPRRKAVLAMLALHRGEIVSTDRLADVLWGDHPPATPVNTLQSHISYLRRLLGSRHAIVPHPPGYLLDAARVGTDVAEAERLISEGRRTTDPAAGSLVREALALWRGRPLADVAPGLWLDEQAGRLEQLRSHGMRRLAEIQLAQGEHAEAIAALEGLVSAHTLDEEACALLMLALYRSGRQADALATYGKVRRALHDELAVDPSPPLRDLETAILRQDPSLDQPAIPAPVVPRAQTALAAAPEPLLEREEPLAALVTMAAEARQGAGRVALIAGEAGVGKSTLVERLQREVPGARWLWTACDGLFTPRPLGPLHDLAEQLGGELLEACASPGADRDHLFRCLLRQIGPASGLDVVVVEDVHWADAATLDLLRHLARRLRDAAVLMLVTYRDDALAAGDRLRIVLGDLASHHTTRLIELAPLSLAAVRTLTEGSGLAPDDLHRLTGGNPFYVSEVLRAGTAAVPTCVRDAVFARAARLGPAAREVLGMAALIGARLEPRLLESVAGDVPGVVDDLLTSGLLITDGTWLRFRHELARRAVAESVPPHRAEDVHALVLATLERDGCDDEARLAFHAEAAGDGAAVLRYAPAAAWHARDMGSHREAVAQLERALRFAAAAPARDRARLYDALAEEAATVDRWPDAEDAAEHALTLWRTDGDPLREGDTLRRLSRIRWHLCRGPDALTTVAAAVEILEPLGPSVELAWAYATFANQRMLESDYPAAEALALRAEVLAQLVGAPEVRSDALDTQAVSAWGQGQEWTKLMREALDVAIAGNYQDQAARAYSNFGSLHVDEHRYPEAEKYLETGLAYCEEHDLTSYAICLRSAQATVMMRQGRWDESDAVTRTLLADAESSPANRLCNLVRLGMLQTRRGEPDRWATIHEAAALATATGEPQHVVPVLLTQAEAGWLEGRLEDAAWAAEMAADVAVGCDPWLLGEVAAWLRRTGSARSPRGEIAEPYDALTGGDPVRAARLWSGLGCPYEAALALADAADEASLREALTILNALRAAPAARVVGERLRQVTGGDEREIRRSETEPPVPCCCP
jgi:DNA-binding SARP family transcriptional activator